LSQGTTGEGGSIIACDDPHSVSEAESDSKRENVCQWFADVFFNRINNPSTGCRLVVGQRIHNSDLSGFILENYREHWCHLNLPYEYSPSRASTTCIGWADPRVLEDQPLWPERFPESAIDQLKKKPKAFASQYNQNPLDTANALFKTENFRYYDETADSYRCNGKSVLKRDCFTLVTADLAISQAKTADYTAICVANVARSGEVILLDMLRTRINGTKIVPTLVEYFNLYRPDYMLIEDVAFQRVIVDQARAEGLPVRQLKAKGDKETRSIPLQVKFDSGQIWFPKDRKFLVDLQKELVEFPQGTWDDQVDALSYMAAEAAGRTRTRPVIDDAPVTKTPAQIYNDALLQGLQF
jgi:predicted phage terminase large subunit-like protein